MTTLPRDLLLAALQGIADAFGIGEIAAVCAANQKSYSEGMPCHLDTAAMTISSLKLGMVKTSAGFYSSPIPIEGKPLESFKGRAQIAGKEKTGNETTDSVRPVLASSWRAARAADVSAAVVRLRPGTVESSTSPFLVLHANCHLTAIKCTHSS